MIFFVYTTLLRLADEGLDDECTAELLEAVKQSTSLQKLVYVTFTETNT